MTRQTNPLIVLAQAMELPNVAEAPEWVHLLPTAKGQITTFDGRGPYVIEDAAAVIQASMAEPRGIPVDENHSTNLAAPQGREAPARGWITAMEARADGIWGQVDWTATGRALMADRAYRGVSPVFILNADGRSLARISVVSLVNKPNLRGLASLHQENDVDMSKIAKALGLADDATEDAILAKIAAMADKKPDAAMTAMQSAMTEIGTALVALQAQVAELTKTGKRAASEAYVDAEMAKKRAGLNATSREDYVALHMEQPDVAKKLIEAMPMLGTSHAAQAPVVDAGGKLTALNAEQTRAAALLGIPPETYLTTLNAERAAQTETF
jgi:phage I-like protein